jgi:hypothetical protein
MSRLTSKRSLAHSACGCRLLYQRTRVEDQNDSTVAKLGRAGDARDLNERVIDRPNNYLSLPEYSVNGDAHGIQTAADYESMKGALVLFVKLE